VKVIWGILLLAFAVLIINAVLHRRRAKKNDDPVGSIVYHIRQWFRESDEYWRRKQAEREAQRIDAANARHATRESTLATIAPPTSSAQKFSKNHRKKIARDNARESKKIFVPPAYLDEVQFSYRDDAGQQTQRRVSVAAVDEQYFEGYCHMRRATRTFITRRVVGEMTSLQTGEIVRSSIWARQMRRHPANRVIQFGSISKPLSSRTGRRSGWKTAVYFAGFHSKRRDLLEALAEDAGWQVRGGFSKSLDIMVTGTLAGSAQMAQAELDNIEIITEQEFRARVHAVYQE
jgi:hypothetical protein